MNRRLSSLVVAVMALTACGRTLQSEGKWPRNDAAPTEPPPPAGISLTDQEIAALQSNRYRGYDAVNRAISQRVADDQSFALAHYIEDTSKLGFFAAFVSTLKDLLGSHKGTGLRSGFSNGTPNSMNVTLWHLAFTGLANDVATICDDPQSETIGPFKARAGFHAAVMKLCAWPISDGDRRAALEAYWNELVHLDAPTTERDAWVEFGESSAMRDVDAATAIHDLTFAALFNPHFLIAK